MPPAACPLQLRRDTYSRLTPVQRLQVARHPNRPTFLDIALNITDKFVELHGDRAGLDDPAMVCGIGSMDGISFMFIGHQKGRNTKVRAARVLVPCSPNQPNQVIQRSGTGQLVAQVWLSERPMMASIRLCKKSYHLVDPGAGPWIASHSSAWTTRSRLVGRAPLWSPVP